MEGAQHQLGAVGQCHVADRAAAFADRSSAARELCAPGSAVQRGEFVQCVGKPRRDERASALALDEPERFAHSPVLRATRHTRATPIAANNPFGAQAASHGSSWPSAASSSPRVIEA